MSIKPPENEELLVAEEVATLLRVKPATVYEAAADGRVPCIRLWKGKRRDLVRFRRSDIESLIKNGFTPNHRTTTPSSGERR